jgi:hypothetical protein
MGYQYKGDQSRPMETIEQARRRNAELRRELAALMFEQADLAPKVEAMRAEVSAARKKLSRQIRDLDAVRAQSARIAAARDEEPTLTDSVYGGREGLLAAADEIEAYEAKPGAKLGTVRRRGPRHGTGRMYSTGCQCGECLGWRKKRTDQEVARQRRRREEFQALKAAAEVAA